MHDSTDQSADSRRYRRGKTAPDKADEAVADDEPLGHRQDFDPSPRVSFRLDERMCASLSLWLLADFDGSGDWTLASLRGQI